MNTNPYLQKIFYGLKNPALTYQLLANWSRFKYSYYFYNYLSLKSLPPVNISLELTTRCNTHCLICGRWQLGIENSIPEILTLKDYKKLFKEVKKFSPIISLTGGEPLLYENLFSVVNLIKKENLFCTLATNGLLLEEKAQQIIKSKIDVLHLSIDGLEKTHNKIRQNNNLFQQAIKGLKKILKLKNNKTKPFIQVIMVINNFNYKEITVLADYLKNLQINSFRVQHLFYADINLYEKHNQLVTADLKVCRTAEEINNTLKDIKKEQINFQELKKEIKKLKNLKLPFAVSFFPDIKDNNLATYYCAPQIPLARKCIDSWVHTVILPNGDVSPCLDFVAGNIKTKSFLNIWNGKKYKYFRNQLKKFSGNFPYCNRCCGIFSHKTLP